MWWRKLNVEADWIRTVWHRRHESCQYLILSSMEWELIMRNNLRSWLYCTCDLFSQAVGIDLATFSLKSSDFHTFILGFALKSSGWAGISWIHVVALATAASPISCSVSVLSTSRVAVGGQPWLHEPTVKLCLTHLAPCLFHFLIPTAKLQRSNLKDASFGSWWLKLWCCFGPFPQGRSRSLCQLAGHLAWEGLWSEFICLLAVKASVNSEMPAHGAEAVWGVWGGC